MTSRTLIELIPLAIVVVGLGFFYLVDRGYRMRGGRIIVRCSAAHLYTTIWIPFVSFKAIRLGPRRFQFCPVGRHWALVEPVNEAELTEDERLMASQYQDSQIP